MRRILVLDDGTWQEWSKGDGSQYVLQMTDEQFERLRSEFGDTLSYFTDKQVGELTLPLYKVTAVVE